MTLKLIEVAMPLKAINEACVAEKKIKSGYPANIHMWWARRPLAASRSVLFAQLVDDPSAHPERFPNDASIEAERQRLFTIMRSLAEPTGPTASVLAEAQAEIQRSVGHELTVLDPFAGGGSIPIEAQRLGLSVEASDLNPVAVLLNRIVLDQIRVANNKGPVHPDSDHLSKTISGRGNYGLVEDIKWYGKLLREKASEKLENLYPKATDEMGRAAPIVSWIWARQIKCPNPGCKAEVPLLATLWLCKKRGRYSWIEPIVDKESHLVSFKVTSGASGPSGKASKIGRGPKFQCYVCEQALPDLYTHGAIDEGKFTFRQLAIAAKSGGQRIYLDASEDLIVPTHKKIPSELDAECRGTFASNAQGRRYGFRTFSDYFMPRQLQTLTVLSELISEIRQEVFTDSDGDNEYADLVASVLGLCVSKLADLANTLCAWEPHAECPRHLFTRQSIPMVWDFAEGNPLGDSSGSLLTIINNTVRALSGNLIEYSRPRDVSVVQANAATRDYQDKIVISTDPPYFDNIGYADLSDFFYVWLRLALKEVHSDLFSTLLTPKVEELVASPHRFDGNKEAANAHFENGFRQVFEQIKKSHHPEIPMTVFYAYKQEDNEEDDESGVTGAGATGWEKLLQGMIDTGLQVTATWPIRTEMAARMIGRGTNALASSVVLTCRTRPSNSPITDRQGFLRHLRGVLEVKLVELKSGGVQPVDLAQASIGPGMAVFSSYSKVLDNSDIKMSVGTALQLINKVLEEFQTEQESEFDKDTLWSIAWFEQFGMASGSSGDALNLVTAKGTAMNALERSGIIETRAGRVRLLSREEYPNDWDPSTDKRLTVWEVCQHLIRRLGGDGGAIAAASLLRQVGGLGDAARDLSYRLYEIANRNGWAEEARAYNNLAAEWPDLVALAAQAPQDSTTLF